MFIAQLKKNIKNKKGFTLIEMLIYIALLGVITVVIVGVFFVISRTNSRITTLIEINSNATSVMERISYEISNADNIYFPTSNFFNTTAYDSLKPAQFSLVTKQGAAVNERSVYVDFYVKNNTIFMKQDGVNPVALTSKNVSVQNVNFYYFKNGNRESVRVDFTVKSSNILNAESKIDLSTVIALRS